MNSQTILTLINPCTNNVLKESKSLKKILRVQTQIYNHSENNQDKYPQK